MPAVLGLLVGAHGRRPHDDGYSPLHELLGQIEGLRSTGEDQAQAVELLRLLEEVPNLRGAMDLHDEAELASSHAGHDLVVGVVLGLLGLLVLLVARLLELLALLLRLLDLLVALLLGLLEVVLQLLALLGDRLLPLGQVVAVLQLGRAVALALVDQRDEAIDLGGSIEDVPAPAAAADADRRGDTGVPEYDVDLAAGADAEHGSDTAHEGGASGLGAHARHPAAHGLLALVGQAPGIDAVDGARGGTRGEIRHAAPVETQRGPGVDQPRANDGTFDPSRSFGGFELGAERHDDAVLDQNGRVLQLDTGAKDDPLAVDPENLVLERRCGTRMEGEDQPAGMKHRFPWRMSPQRAGTATPARRRVAGEAWGTRRDE